MICSSRDELRNKVPPIAEVETVLQTDQCSVTNPATANTRRVKSSDVYASLTLLAAAVLFFIDLIPGRFLLIERDLSAYFIPPRFFWVESIKRGDFPLWNPYQFCGYPFFANPQYAILYPLNSIFFILPFDIAFNTIIVLHFFLSGVFTYLLLRDLKAGAVGALIAGLIFMLSGYLLSIHSLLPTLLTVTWTPLIIMFFRRALMRPGSSNEIITAVLMAVSFLGGGLENVYGNVIILLLMLFFCAERHKNLLYGFRSLAMVLCIFALLAAIQLIPCLELFSHSIRGRGLSFHEATTWSFSPKDMLLFFFNDAYGYFINKDKYWSNQCWLKTLYTGGLPFILSLLYFLLGRGRKLYAALIVSSVFLSLGQYNPLYPLLFNYVPLFGGLRYPVKFLYIAILTLSITSGLGFQALCGEQYRARIKKLLLSWSCVSALLLLLLTLQHETIEGLLKIWGFDFPAYNYLAINLFHAKRFLFYCILFLLLLWVGCESGWKKWASVLLTICLIADLFGIMGFYGKEKTADYFKKTRIEEIITADRDWFRTFSTAKTTAQDSSILLAGCSPFEAMKEKHLPTMNMLYNIHDMWGLDVIRLQRSDDLYGAFTTRASIGDTNLLELYGVKYVVSVTPLDKERSFELVSARLEGLSGAREELINKNTIKLYQTRNFHERAWLVKNYRVLAAKEILQPLLSKSFHPDQEVFLEEQPQWEGDVAHAAKPGSVRMLSESNNSLRLRVTVPQNSLLAVSDTYYPGWKAVVYPVQNNEVWKSGGKPKKIMRANYAFRAIALEPGEYEVHFTYEPVSFKIGAFISLLTVIGIALWFYVRRKK